MADYKEERDFVMTIELSGDIERVIQAAIASRRFANAEEFISAMAELWQERERGQPLRGDLDTDAYAAFERLGILGCMKSGPSDLATNPVHFEGFGK